MGFLVAEPLFVSAKQSLFIFPTFSEKVLFSTMKYY